MKRLISTYISAMLLLTGCDPMVHEYPTSGPPVEFSVYLSADLTPPAVYKEITYTKGHGRNVVTRSTPAPDYYFDNSQHLLRFIVEVYDGNRREAESDPGRLVGRQEIITEIDARAPQCKASFTLPHGDYTIVGWSDYANKQDPGKLIYDCSNLYEITYATAPIEDNHSKETFSNVMEHTIVFNYKESSAPPVTLGMTRPKGYYKIIATDLAEFEESGKTLNDIRVEISYKQFVSTGYNTITQSPNKYQQTHTYSMDPLTITENGADAALVGYDYVFVNGTQSTVKADLMVYDSADNLLRTTTDIEIPLVRNKQTIIKGQFLTTSFGSGGMDVDEEFEGEIIIPVN